MNVKHIYYSMLGLLSSVFFFSCNSDDNSTGYTNETNDAQIYSFTLTAPFSQEGDSASRAQDSLRIIVVNKTNYSIDQVGGVIYNADSLPYMTNLKNVSVSVSFNPTFAPLSIEVQTPDSTYFWNTADSINFSKLPVKFIVTSQGSGNNSKTYNIDIRTHQIDPNSIVWQKMSSFNNTGNSKTLLVNNEFFTYVADGAIKLNTALSTQPSSWTNKVVRGLPSDVLIQSFVYLNSSFNVIDRSGNSYTSADGVNWQKVAPSQFVVKSIVGALPSSLQEILLTVVEINNVYYFAKGSNLSNLVLVENIGGSARNRVPASFPVEGFSSYSNNSSDTSQKTLLVTAGNDETGNALNRTWLIRNSVSGIDLTSVVQQSPFIGGDGVSIFGYDHRFYVLQNKQFFITDNWGEVWTQAPGKQVLDSDIRSVKGQTVLVDNQNYLWIFGGKSSSGQYLNEVWRGRLNKLIP